MDEICCEHCGKYEINHHGPHKNCFDGWDVGSMMKTGRHDLLNKTYTKRSFKMFMHTTQSGKQIPLSLLPNHELKAGINILINNVKHNLNLVSIQTDTLDEATMLLAGLGDIAKFKHDAKYAMEDAINKLPHYIMEAQIRGINFSEELQNCFNRNSIVKLNQFNKALEEKNGEE